MWRVSPLVQKTSPVLHVNSFLNTGTFGKVAHEKLFSGGSRAGKEGRWSLGWEGTSFPLFDLFHGGVFSHEHIVHFQF